MGVTPCIVSRSLTALSARPSSSILQSSIITSDPSQPRRRHKLYKSHSLGENDVGWIIDNELAKEPSIPDFWRSESLLDEPTQRVRSYSLNVPTKKMVTYEDEVLARRRSNHQNADVETIVMTVPYEPELSREIILDSQLKTARSGNLDFSKELSARKSSALSPKMAKRISSGRNSHTTGTYYGYDSECSGAETEIFLSDRSLDRTFSHDTHVEPIDLTQPFAQQELHHEVYVPTKIGPSREEFLEIDQSYSSYPMKDRVSFDIESRGENNTLPRARRPARDPRLMMTPHRKCITRANTEGSLLKNFNSRSHRDLSSYVPECESIYSTRSIPLRESSVDDIPLATSREIQGTLQRNASWSQGLRHSDIRDRTSFEPIEAYPQPEMRRPQQPMHIHGDERSYNSSYDNEMHSSNHRYPPLDSCQGYPDGRQVQSVNDRSRYPMDSQYDDGRQRYPDNSIENRPMYSNNEYYDGDRQPENRDRYGPHPDQGGPIYGPPCHPDDRYGPQMDSRYIPPPNQMDPRYGPPKEQTDSRYGPPPCQSDLRYAPGSNQIDPRYDHNQPDSRYQPTHGQSDPRYMQPSDQVDSRHPNDQSDPRYGPPRDQHDYRYGPPHDQPMYSGPQGQTDPRYGPYNEQIDRRYCPPQGQGDLRYESQQGPNDPRYPPQVQGDPRYQQNQSDPRYCPPQSESDPRYVSQQAQQDPRYCPPQSESDPRYASQQTQQDPRYGPPPSQVDPRFNQPDPRYDQRVPQDSCCYVQSDNQNDPRYSQDDPRYGPPPADGRYPPSGHVDGGYGPTPNQNDRRYNDDQRMQSRDRSRYDRENPRSQSERSRYEHQEYTQESDRRMYPPDERRPDIRDRHNYPEEYPNERAVPKESCMKTKSVSYDIPRNSREESQMYPRDRHYNENQGYPPRDNEQPSSYTYDSVHRPPERHDRHDRGQSHMQTHDMSHARDMPDPRTYPGRSYNDPHHSSLADTSTYPDSSRSNWDNAPQATDVDRPLTSRVRHSSTVSINEHPEYFEFDANSPPSTEPRADADVDPSSNPPSEFSQRITTYGPAGGGYGASKRGSMGRSLSTGEVPETEKTGWYFLI